MIYSPRFNSNRIKTGNARVGTGVTEITVSDLEPNTLYLVYFVTQGSGQIYSPQPMLYQFWTEEVYRPNLSVVRTMPSTVDLLVNNMNAVVDYAVFQLDRISTTPLGYNLKDYVAEEMRSEWDSEKDEIKNLKVYESFMEYIPGDPYTSYFSKYANSDFKRSVASLIESNVTTPARLSGSSKNLTQGRSVTVDCVKELKIPEVVEYFFAAASWFNDPNTNDHSSRNVRPESMAFAGVYPVYQSDTTPPKLYSISGSLTVDYSKSATNPTVSGTVDLQFDKTIYYFN